MKLNNKGVSLVELIVTIAILGIISVGVQGFTLVSAKINSNVNSNVKLQYESQLVMANVQKQLASAGTGVFWDATKKTLLTLTENDVSIFAVNGDILYYGEEDGISDLNTASVSVYKLAEYVKGFSVTFKDFTDEVGVKRATQADITVTIERNGKEYTGTKSVALRNKPKIIDSCSVTITTVNV